MLRHGIGVSIGGPSLLCHDRKPSLLCRDKKFSIAIEKLGKSVATKTFVLRQGLDAEGGRARGYQALSAHDNARNVRTLCTRPACDRALCCALFGSLFMDTVYEHYSWALFKRKKSTTSDPRELGRLSMVSELRYMNT